ncbi:O-antigen ligase family protein [Thermodesulfobacteriota bacterium]
MGLTTLLITGIFFFLFLGTFWRPIFGIQFYLCVYILFNPYSWWATIFKMVPRPSLFAAMVAIGGTLIHAKKAQWSISRREIELYLFLGAVWLSSMVFGVGLHENSWIYLDKVTKIFLFLFFFLRVVHSLETYKYVMWTIILTGLFFTYQAHIAGSGVYYDGRLDSLGGADFSEGNSFASFIVSGITFLGFQMLRFAWWKKFLCIIALAPMLNTVIMVQSRGVFLGMLIAALFILLRPLKAYRKQLFLYLILGLVAFSLLASTQFLDRMKTISGYIKSDQSGVTAAEDGALGRFDFWKASVAIFKDHPFGIGVKNFEEIVSQYDPRNPGLDAHNTYVLCYTEIGILGFVLYMIIIFEALAQIRRIRKLTKGTISDSEISILALSLSTVLLIYITGTMPTHSLLYSEFTWILLSMPICLENAAKKLLEDENNSTSERVA